MRTMITAILAALVVATAGVAGPAAASGGSDLRLESAPIDRMDVASLQRGAKTFVNYCLNCHSAKFMRYNRLTDIALTPEMIQDSMMFTTGARLGDTMQITLAPRDAKLWFGAPPPDLSVEARVRGKEWLYNYFLAFYQDDASASGWNNLVFPNVGMPHVLWKQSGISRLVTTEYKSQDEAEAAAIAAKGLAQVVQTKDHKYAVETLVVDTPGTMSPAEYRQTVADLVNYLDFMAEPNKTKARTIGIIMVLLFGVLFVFAFLMKREYWKDVH
jgi:ubiquinol-cytochrome c reductase cytochrome c1 subunit